MKELKQIFTILYIILIILAYRFWSSKYINPYRVKLEGLKRDYIICLDSKKDYEQALKVEKKLSQDLDNLKKKYDIQSQILDTGIGTTKLDMTYTVASTFSNALLQKSTIDIKEDKIGEHKVLKFEITGTSSKNEIFSFLEKFKETPLNNLYFDNLYLNLASNEESDKAKESTKEDIKQKKPTNTEPVAKDTTTKSDKSDTTIDIKFNENQEKPDKKMSYKSNKELYFGVGDADTIDELYEEIENKNITNNTKDKGTLEESNNKPNNVESKLLDEYLYKITLYQYVMDDYDTKLPDYNFVREGDKNLNSIFK